MFTLARTGYVSPSNYANTYGPITEEGTYTFRFHGHGEAAGRPPVGRGDDHLALVGVKVDPFTSFLFVNQGQPAPGRDVLTAPRLPEGEDADRERLEDADRERLGAGHAVSSDPGGTGSLAVLLRPVLWLYRSLVRLATGK